MPVTDGYRYRQISRMTCLCPNSNRHFAVLHREHKNCGQKVDEAGADLLQAGLDQHRKYQLGCEAHVQEMS
jgi:hypothetical protein